MNNNNITNIAIFIGRAPMLEIRICEGLLKFGQTHPQWRFSLQSADFRYTPEWLKQHNISGVLALIDSKHIEGPLNAAGIPWVHLYPPEPVTTPFVSVDNILIGKMGANFFISKGFMCCAFCGTDTFWSTERAIGFKQKLAEKNLECSFIDIPLEGEESWEMQSGTKEKLESWIANLKKGTAVMAAHDVLANRIVDICLTKGFRVPQDITVLGVGNHDLYCQLSPVPISSIDTNIPKAAIACVEMLETMLTSKQNPESKTLSSFKIIERRSTKILAYGDDLIVKALSYIHDNACSGISVEDILKILPISRPTLSRRFKKYVGHSPSAEIRRVRLKHAKYMIANSTLSLTEIAFACGYSDLPHMDRSILKETGTSPKGLRNHS